MSNPEHPQVQSCRADRAVGLPPISRQSVDASLGTQFQVLPLNHRLQDRIVPASGPGSWDY
jgi:hypothetical protein